MSSRLNVAVFNYEAGGRKSPGQYDFVNLQTAFASVEEAPHLVVINEAKEWNLWGQLGVLAATNALSEQLGRPYEGRLGQGTRGPASTPAIIYDPQVVRLDFLGDSHESVHPDKRNIGLAHVWGKSASKFRIVPQHWNPYSGDGRMEEARLVGGFAKGMPTLLAGDLNCTASGPHLPQMDWEIADDELRLNKAIEIEEGVWTTDTRAVDFLLGAWSEKFGRRRVIRKIGWHALAELAHAAGTPAEQAFLPTVNRGVDKGGGLLIDWLIVNEAWKEGLVPNTYAVHVPEGMKRSDYPSDHRLVTASLELD